MSTNLKFFISFAKKEIEKSGPQSLDSLLLKFEKEKASSAATQEAQSLNQKSKTNSKVQ